MRAVLLALVACGLGAAPPVRPTAEQVKARGERIALWNEGLKAWRDGKQAEAIAALQRALRIERGLSGAWHRDTAMIAGRLAGWHQARGEWAGEAEHRRDVSEARRRLYGGADWRTVDAAWEQRTAELRVSWTAQQNRDWEEAEKLSSSIAFMWLKGESDKALPLAKRELSLRRSLAGDDHPATARALFNLAAQHQALGDRGSALPLFRRALEATRRAKGEKHRDYARSLTRLAEVYQSMGDARSALPLARQALEIEKPFLGETSSAYATGLDNLAELYKSVGDHRSALPLQLQARAIRKRVLGERHPDYATSLNNLAMLYEALGEHEEALKLHTQALDIYKRALGERHPHYANSLHNLAGLYRSMGDFRSALPLYKQSLAIRKKSLGDRHPHYAASLNNLAVLYKDMGDHRSALPLYKQALDVCRRAVGERHPHYAASLNNLGLLYTSMGDHRSALPLFKRALELTGKALGEEHPNYARSLNNLAFLHSSMGDHRAALPLFKQALDIKKQAVGGRHPDYALGLNNLARVHQVQGDHEAALPLYEQARAITRRALGERHPEYARSLNNLAALHEATGDPGAALPLFEQAADITRRALGDMHPNTAQSYQNLAALHGRQGRVGAALVYSEQAAVLARRRLAQDASVQSERQQREGVDALRDLLSWRLSLPDESAHFTHNHLLGWKGAAFAAQQARRRFLVTEADAATRELATRLREVTRPLALLRGRTDAASRERAERLAMQKQDLEVRLAEVSADYRLAVRPPSSDQLRASLPPGTVLLDFLVHTGYDPSRPIKGQTQQRRLVVWVVRAGAATVRLNLGPMGAIEEDIQAWRAAIEKGEDGGDVPARLREKTWGPLEKHVAGAKAILVSPDGALGRLPFAALPGREKGRCLLEEVPLAILPVPQVLAQVLERPRGELSLLTLGGVDYGVGKDWAALPGTEAEAEEVAARFRGQFKGEVASLTGPKASKAALREALQRHRFIHLATHGFFALPEMKSFLDHEDRGPGGLFGREGVTGWDPALLSGLVLAGANRPTTDDDGILTASEVAEMDLSGVELTVLSACQTGRGKEAGGEGILGLQRAFAMSGCKTAVSSLWDVHDAATAVLMERFYLHLWDKKLGKLEALRRAQTEILHHPEWVEARVALLAKRGVTGLRGAGKAAEVVVGTKKERRSPAAWWGAWQLSGDWR